MAFSQEVPVMFKHCDPAGIVFYPRYFEMINDCVETFFDQVLDYPFGRIHPNTGVPTVQLDTNFKAPSRLGDLLVFRLTCQKLGRTSLGFRLEASCDGQPRLVAQQTIVHVDAQGKPTGWPQAVRTMIQNQLETT